MKGTSDRPVRIDLLSDTLTRPTPAMRAAMAEAEVGDDVFGEDPTTRRLEEQIADLLGKQAALFMPSGTMSNAIGLLVHCGRGDEFLCEANCHIFNYEQAGYAQLGGLAVQPLPGEQGMPSIRQLQQSIRKFDDHQPRSRLVCLEQTHNRASGKVLPYDQVAETCRWAQQLSLARHLDGARLFNAVVASGITAPQWCQHFDTVSVCFSKGLGAPVGSALCGSVDQMRQARRYRKLLGGGMRQSGILAAAAQYALEYHVERLAEDHAKAQALAVAVKQCPGLSLGSDTVDTNIVLFEIDESRGTAADLCKQLLRQGVRLGATGAQRVRAVTHLDVSLEDCLAAGEILRRLTTP